MSITIAFYNNKGGVSKTISAASVGAFLVSKGYKALLIDMDPQANLSQHFGNEEPDLTLFDVIIEGRNLLDLIKPVYRSLHIIPSDESLYALDYHLHEYNRKEFILRKHNQDYLNSIYDFIIIDCPAFFNQLTINALAASDLLMIPANPDCFSLNNITQLMEMVGNVKSELDISFNVGGIFLTNVESDSIYEAARKILMDHFPEEYLDLKIRNDCNLAKAPMFGVDIFRYDPNSKGAKDYAQLSYKILEYLNLEFHY